MFCRKISRYSSSFHAVRLFSSSAYVPNHSAKHTTAAEAAQLIKSGDNIYVHGIAAVPTQLINAMTERHNDLRDVKLYHIHTEGEGPYMKPGYEKSFRAVNMFTAANAREAVQKGRADFIPVFLSEIPLLFKRRKVNLDIALITCSPPDKHGFLTLGTSVDCTVAAIENAKLVIAQINPNMPRTHGDGQIHISSIHSYIDVDDPIYSSTLKTPSAVESEIGRRVAQLVEDGSTLQMGIGAIPDATLSFITDKKRLGVHTEMFSDGLLNLVEKGVVTGEEKEVHPGKITATFLLGSKQLYDYVDDNPFVEMRTCDFTNHPAVIARNPKVTAINSALEIDLTGQICADSIGGKIYSGVGGQMDFLRGASLSQGGKPIIALPSTTHKGQSRIVPTLKKGAGVVTTRANVHWVVTEYGAVNLWGMPIYERQKALISISHPSHQEALEKAVHDQYWLQE